MMADGTVTIPRLRFDSIRQIVTVARLLRFLRVGPELRGVIDAALLGS